ncbi:MAG: hypothetical protein ACR2G6_07890 [Gemmatimonadaceae bacterium]
MHTTTGHDALEVLALPFDPATIRMPSRVSANGAPSFPAPPGVAAVRDSAIQLDATFQRSRVTLNREALAMHRAERASTSYARAFDLWSKRALEAEEIRTTRDRLRARLAASGAEKETGTLSSSYLPLQNRLALAQIDAAARRNSDDIVRATVRNGVATLMLTAGAWWIALTFEDGTALVYPQKISIAAAMRDTLRLPVPGLIRDP